MLQRNMLATTRKQQLATCKEAMADESVPQPLKVEFKKIAWDLQRTNMSAEEQARVEVDMRARLSVCYRIRPN